MATAADPSEILHASCVAVAGRAALIRGASGQGKSALALQLLALGGELVADDRTRVWRQDQTLWAEAPDTIQGQIEARGVGILAARPAGPTPVALVIDLDRSETERLPPERGLEIAGVHLPLVLGQQGVHFPAAIVQYLKMGRLA